MRIALVVLSTNQCTCLILGRSFRASMGDVPSFAHLHATSRGPQTTHSCIHAPMHTETRLHQSLSFVHIVTQTHRHNACISHGLAHMSTYPICVFFEIRFHVGLLWSSSNWSTHWAGIGVGRRRPSLVFRRFEVALQSAEEQDRYAAHTHTHTCMCTHIHISCISHCAF